MGTVSDELNLVSVRRGLSTSSSSDFISDSPKNDLISKSKKKILVKRRNGQNRGLELNLKHKSSKLKGQEQILRVAGSLFVVCWLLALTWLTFSMKEEKEQNDNLSKSLLEPGGVDNQSEKIKILENRIIVLEKRLMTLEDTFNKLDRDNKEKESLNQQSVSVSTSTSTLNPPPSTLNATLPATI